MKKVSVIIPCFNLSKDDVSNTVSEKNVFSICMESVMNQTLGLSDMEIILVNDASTDGGLTSGMLAAYERQYPDNIMVIELAENQRQGGARNIGLSYATAEYVAFLDADDWVEEDTYKKAYQKAKENDADMVYFYHDAVRGNLSVPMDDMDAPEGLYVIDSVEKRKQFLMSQVVDLRCTTKLYRRSMLIEYDIAFPAHKIYEEPMFTYPCQMYGERFYVLPEILYHYRMNEASTMNTAHSFEKLKHHPEVQLQLFTEFADRGLLDNYFDEISYHFLHSFFYETLLFARNQHIKIPSEYLSYMRNVVDTLLPDWKDNPYLDPTSETYSVLCTNM